MRQKVHDMIITNAAPLLAPWAPAGTACGCPSRRWTKEGADNLLRALQYQPV